MNLNERKRDRMRWSPKCGELKGSGRSDISKIFMYKI